jgi:hypothetical protein
MIDFTKPVTTRSGLVVDVVSISLRGDYPVGGYLGEDDTFIRWSKDGKYFISRVDSEFDLVNLPTTIVRYFNVYPQSYTSRERADWSACGERLACIRVEFREGQYDN